MPTAGSTLALHQPLPLFHPMSTTTYEGEHEGTTKAGVKGFRFFCHPRRKRRHGEEINNNSNRKAFLKLPSEVTWLDLLTAWPVKLFNISVSPAVTSSINVPN